MHRGCHELSKLPKSSKFKAVVYKKQTPGSIADLQNPFGGAIGKGVLDRSHPGAQVNRNSFPYFSNNVFNFRAFPQSLLAPPKEIIDSPPVKVDFELFSDRLTRLKELYPLPWKNSLFSAEHVGKYAFLPGTPTKHKPNQIPMSLDMVLSIKKLGKHRVIRSSISKKIKVAIGLIVSRGVDVQDEEGNTVLYDHKGWRLSSGNLIKKLDDRAAYKWKIVLNEEGVGEPLKKWILPGWTYIFNPNLEIYQMPLPVLIPQLRHALLTIFANGSEMEKAWVKRAENSLRVVEPKKPDDDASSSPPPASLPLPPPPSPPPSSYLRPQKQLDRPTRLRPLDSTSISPSQPPYTLPPSSYPPRDNHSTNTDTLISTSSNRLVQSSPPLRQPDLYSRSGSSDSTLVSSSRPPYTSPSRSYPPWNHHSTNSNTPTSTSPYSRVQSASASRQPGRPPRSGPSDYTPRYPSQPPYTSSPGSYSSRDHCPINTSTSTSASLYKHLQPSAPSRQPDRPPRPSHSDYTPGHSSQPPYTSPPRTYRPRDLTNTNTSTSLYKHLQSSTPPRQSDRYPRSGSSDHTSASSSEYSRNVPFNSEQEAGGERPPLRRPASYNARTGLGAVPDRQWSRREVNQDNSRPYRPVTTHRRGPTS